MNAKGLLEETIFHSRPFDYQTKLSTTEVVERIRSVMDKSKYKPFGSVTLDGTVTESGISVMRYGMGQRRVKLNATLLPSQEGVLLAGQFQNYGAPVGIAVLMLLILGWSFCQGTILLITSDSPMDGLISIIGGLFFSTVGIVMNRVLFSLLNLPDIRNIKLALEEVLDGI